ncbi:GNAT family N-acetyltransferase [Actinoplanes sp. N902-109]|uniref:GNAT family N-acetyltransferase n=1 Tax=Actinoplanes sp. (strain N902-109) TaxID=649831 RepID=UPI00032935F6|nr:GNAT family N-acetyltransferase [Actinoplanes sp. N902-109]AGL14405.1 GCN5-related N-acetyltransferase [Actinoplanes sp. N902-109]
MGWHSTDDVNEFLTAAGEFLHRQPVRNTVLITVADTVKRRGPQAYGADTPLFGWAEDGAFVRTPPMPAVLSAMSDATAAALAELIEGPLPGVTGPDAAVAAFTRAWQRRTGGTAQVGVRMRLFRLDQLVQPAPAPVGTARICGPADRELLIDWTTEMFREVGEMAKVPEFVDERMSYGGQMVWEIDGNPVSMAAITRPEAGMVRIQAVYTPREHRGHGYAAGVTAALSRAALDAGASDVVLFTDLANPTANALYPRIGYVPLEDRTTMEFPS